MRILKVKIPAAIFICVLFVSIQSYGKEKENIRFSSFVLENGMRIFLYEKHALPLLNIVFAFDMGTKNEEEDTSGLVHILEHYILFRGTQMRTGEEIGRDIRAHGAYFNAHTGRDIATFELSLPSEFTDFALNNQKEILFQLKLTQEELEKEKQIILEELSQIKDDAFRYATALAYQNLFKDHPYEKPLYGKEEIIRAATVEEIQRFHHKYFVPANCALAIVGDFYIDEIQEKITALFGGLENDGFVPPKFDMVSPIKKDVEIEVEMDVNTGYLVIGKNGPDYNSTDQFAVDVLVEVLGRGVVPMLNRPLRGKREIVETLSMGFGAYEYGGIIYIQLTLEPKKIPAAKREALQFLKNARKLSYSKADYQGDAQFYALDYLESAKNQIEFRFHQSQESGLNLALSMATHALRSDGSERVPYIDSIESISSSNLREAAGNYFSKGGYVLISVVPKKGK